MLTQSIIALTGALAIWLSQDAKQSRQRWAPIFGLAGQPFWLIETWHASQWGMFALTLAFIAGWSRGLARHWLRRVKGAADG